MDLGLKGRVAVVGGGSRGLGKACALSLAREGANVAICSRGVESLEAAAKEIRSTTGAEVLAVPADLSRLADIRDLLQKTVDHFGRLDVVVCNSGGPPEGRAVDTSEETWDQAIQMALTFFIRMGREAVPHLKNRSWGRIVNILASTVYQPIDNLVTSGVTRMGAVAFAKSLADEVGRDNILVNNVAPGFLLTDRMVGFQGQRNGGVGGYSAPGPRLRHTHGTIREARRIGRSSCIPGFGKERLYHRHDHISGWRRRAVGALTPEPLVGSFTRLSVSC